MEETKGNAQKVKVTVIGGTVVDIAISVPKKFLHHLVKLDALELPFGSKLSSDGYTINPGGSGANVAVGLARLGLNTTLTSTVSTDEFGVFLEKKLSEELTSLNLKRFNEPSPISVILSVGAERTIITVHDNREEDLEKLLPDIGHIHVGPLSSKMSETIYQKLVSHIIKTDQTLSMNPSMYSIEQSERAFLSALRTASILVVNQEEGARLARLAPKTGPEEVVAQLRRLTEGVICLTCGERGAYVNDSSDKRVLFARAATPMSERINATGAGDAFTTGFLARYLLTGRQEQEVDKIENALKWAMINSGSVVSHIGAQSGLLRRDQIEKDLKTVNVTIR